MSKNKFNNINTTKSLNDDIFFYAEPISAEKLKQPLKDKKIYVKVVFYNKDKEELLIDEPNNVKVRDVIKEDIDFFAKKNFEYNQDIIISHKFNIKDFLMSKGFKERKDIENQEGKLLEDVKYISCWIDANNDEEVSIEYNEEVVVRVCKCSLDVNKFIEEYKKIHTIWDSKSQKYLKLKLNSISEEGLRRLIFDFNRYYSNNNKPCNLEHIAYMLATVKIESYNYLKNIMFNPITELGGDKYAENLYDPVLGNNKIAKELGNSKKGDGVKYKGRGFVQITGKYNYKTFTDKLGINFIDYPEKALEWDNSFKIMINGMEQGLFTSYKLSDFINESKKDYFNARKIINRMNKAEVFEKYAKEFEQCLKKAKC